MGGVGNGRKWKTMETARRCARSAGLVVHLILVGSEFLGMKPRKLHF